MPGQQTRWRAALPLVPPSHLRQMEATLGKFAIECCRIDMIPGTALERLGIHNELCAMKWDDPSGWLKEGFKVSGRIDSMKRHYESIHARDDSEDHMAHLIWGFMAVAHVVAVFPQACLDRLAQTSHPDHGPSNCLPHLPLTTTDERSRRLRGAAPQECAPSATHDAGACGGWWFPACSEPAVCASRATRGLRNGERPTNGRRRCGDRRVMHGYL